MFIPNIFLATPENSDIITELLPNLPYFCFMLTNS